MRKVLLFLGVLLLTTTISSAQFTEQDSLKLSKLREQVRKKSSDSVASVTHNILKKINEPINKTYAYSLLGLYYRHTSKGDSTIYYLEKAIDILQNERDSIYQIRLSECYSSLGHFYSTRGLDDKALPYYLKGIEVAEKIQDEDMIMIGKGNIAQIYSDHEEYDKAASIYTDIISSYQGETKQIVSAAYSNLGLAEYEQNNIEESLKNYKKALQLFEEDGDYDGMIIIHLNLGNVYTTPEEKESSYRKALEIAEKYNLTYHIQNATFNLGNVYKRNKEYDKAKRYYLKALSLAQKHQYYTIERLVYLSLYETYKEQKEYEKSIDYLNKHYKFTQYLDSLEQDKNYNELKIKYETSEKENEILSLREQQLINEHKIQKENTIKWSILIGFIILLIPIIFLLYTYYQRMHTQQKLNDKLVEVNQQKVAALLKDQELKLVKASIEGKDQERQRIAQQLHDSVGGNLSSIKLQLDNIEEGKNSFKKVVRQIDDTYNLVREISHNLIPIKFSKNPFTSLIREYIQNVESSNDLSIAFNSFPEDELNQIVEKLQVELFSIIQELLTNVLKHSKASEVTIQLDYFEDKITLFFEDNGVGFNAEKIHMGMGLGNIKSRLKKLNGKMLIDTKQYRGTLININIFMS